jgi:diaminohydroxyphosphoribosylaminopyrimidine deaminase/5-amino-6-(5-phosphoribosylamino)uracil reductase
MSVVSDANKDVSWMRKALRLATRGFGKTHPNPYVGCVIVCREELVGQGYHKAFGKAHAEVEAIEDAKRRLGASFGRCQALTLYCTLEPCNHFGKTAPCTEIILKHSPPIRRVVVGTLDPNPLVSGKGVERLSRAGLDVSLGVLSRSCFQVNEDYFQWVRTRLPHVVLKAAVSLDGKIAAPDGSSKWISSKHGLSFAHELRLRADAILVGVETVIADNPRLTARDALGRVRKKPIRVLLDSHLRVPLDASIVADEDASKTWVFCSSEHDSARKEALLARGVSVCVAAGNSAVGGVDLGDVLRVLGSKEVVNILVEGGSRVLTSFILSGRYDTLYLNMAPKLIGMHGVPFIQETGVRSIEDALSLEFAGVRRNGPDILVVLKKANPPCSQG